VHPVPRKTAVFDQILNFGGSCTLPTPRRNLTCESGRIIYCGSAGEECTTTVYWLTVTKMISLQNCTTTYLLASLPLLLSRIASYTTYIDAAYYYRPSSVYCLSICRYIFHTSEPCENGWTDRDAVWVMDSGGPKEACIRWGPDPACEGAVIGGKDMPGHAQRHSAVSCAKMAEPIDLPLGLWTRVD